MNRAVLVLGLALAASLAVNAGFALRHMRGIGPGVVGMPTPPSLSEIDSGDTSKTDVLIAGDSIAQFCPWSGYLGRPVLNAGIMGETSAQLSDRIPALKAHGAKTLIILTGANDLHAGLPPAAILANIEAVSKVAPRTLVIGVLPADPAILDPKAVQELDGLLAKEFGANYIAPPAGWDWHKDTFDGLHPNGDGYTLICSELRKRL